MANIFNFLRCLFVLFFLSVITCHLNAQSSISPSSISGLKLWLKSDVGVTLNSGNVSNWADQSGNGNDVFQPSASNQPAYVLNTLNGYPTLRFLDDYLTTPSINIGQRTEFFVIKRNGLSTGVYHTLIMSQNPPYYQLYVMNGDSSFYSDPGDHHITFTSKYQIISRVISTSQFSFYKNGIQGNTLPYIEGSSNQPLNIGTFNGNQNLNGDITELLIYDQPLNDTDRNSVEQYLHNKYAPPVKLGPDKTVCSLPYTVRAKKDYFTNYLWTGGSTDDSLVVNAAGNYVLTTTDIFGSTSKDTVTVTLNGGAYTVNLGSDISICSGQQKLINAGPSHLSYIWSNGATTNSILVNSSSSYTVSVKDCIGNTSQDAINTVVVPYPAFSLGLDQIVCYTGSNPLVLTPNIVGSFSYLWSTGSTASSISVNTSGAYSLQLTNPGCSSYDTINVLIDNFPQIASLGPDTTLCIGNSIYLKTGASQAATYSWSGGSTNDSLMISSPGQYSLTATSINGCIKKDIINITIKGSAPMADFSFTSVCLGSSSQFTELSSAPLTNTITSRAWDFGDITLPSTLTSPSHTYADTGAYIVTYTVTTNIGCSAELSKTLKVFPYPQGNFTSANLCERDSVHFTALATTFGYPITQWNWNFAEASSGGVNNVSTLQNPAHIYAASATYSVTLTIQNAFGCSTPINNSLVIKPSPTTDFNFSSLCEKQSISFNDITILPAPLTKQSGSWNFGDNTALSPFINPIHTYTVSNTYNVVHTITASNGCSNTNTKALKVNPKPTALYTAGNACVSLPTIFSDSSVISGGTITNWLWTYAVGMTSTLKNGQHTFNAALSPQVKLLVTSDKGCKDSITKTIVIHPVPIANFTSTPDNGSPPLAVSFTNNSIGASIYKWDFGNSNHDSLANTHTVFTDTGSYYVSLIAINSFGCADTTKNTIDVLEAFIDVAVQNIVTVLQNNFLIVSTQIINKGTVDVKTLELTVTLNNGAVVKENWTGLLLRGGVIVDTISTSIYMKDPKSFVCVSAIKPNNLDDEFPLDNESCIAIDKSSFEVLEPYPNPAGEFITLPLLIPASNNLDVTICNARGQSLRTIYSGTITEGLQLITVNLIGLGKGFYAFTIVYDGKTVVKKFIIE